jgi:hypothetical protein
VVVGIGNAGFGRTVAAVGAGMCQNFDGLLEHFEAVLAYVDAQFGQLVPLNETYYAVELFVAGWSASRNRPETYHLVRHQLYPETAERCGMLDPTLPLFGRGPGIDGPCGYALRRRDRENIDLATEGLVIIEAARETKELLPPLNVFEGYSVGGFCELATITPLAVERRIVRRWPDEVGRAIELRRSGG